MTKKSIYQFSDYKAYLKDLEDHGPYKGFRSRLAEATGCQNAFVSQVLNGEVNFNLEQALKIADFLHLKNDEHPYFMWMVEYKRAGTVELRKYFQQMMIRLREKNSEIRERVQIPQVLSSEAQTVYYSNWMYAAIHMAAMIGSLNTVTKMASALQISEIRVSEVIEFLLTNGLLEGSAHSFRSGKIQIHLGRDAGNISKHHTNWRIEAIKSLDSPAPGNLHYSGVSSLSETDVDKIKTMFVDLIETYVRTIEKSPEETLYTFNLDFFRVMKRS
jgi:uncharacterized protein (TIGR02147 family)